MEGGPAADATVRPLLLTRDLCRISSYIFYSFVLVADLSARAF